MLRHSQGHRGEDAPGLPWRGLCAIPDRLSRQCWSSRGRCPGLFPRRRLQSCDAPASPAEPPSHSPRPSCGPCPTELSRRSSWADSITALGSPSCGLQRLLCLRRLRLSPQDLPPAASCLKAVAVASALSFLACSDGSTTCVFHTATVKNWECISSYLKDPVGGPMWFAERWESQPRNTLQIRKQNHTTFFTSFHWWSVSTIYLGQ